MKLQHLYESYDFSRQDAIRLAEKLGLPTDDKYLKQFMMGLKVEQEHNKGDLDVINSPTDVAKIAAAHLKEFPDYYTRLKKMEG